MDESQKKNSGTLDGFDYVISLGSDALHLEISERYGLKGSVERVIGFGFSFRQNYIFRNIGELQAFTNVLYRQVRILTALQKKKILEAKKCVQSTDSSATKKSP